MTAGKPSVRTTCHLPMKAIWNTLNNLISFLWATLGLDRALSYPSAVSRPTSWVRYGGNVSACRDRRCSSPKTAARSGSSMKSKAAVPGVTRWKSAWLSPRPQHGLLELNHIGCDWPETRSAKSAPTPLALPLSPLEVSCTHPQSGSTVGGDSEATGTMVQDGLWVSQLPE